MYILVPPSEGKSLAPGKTSFSDTCPEWRADTEGALRLLRKLKAAERPKWYGVRDTAKAAQCHKQNLACLDTPGLPAIERYTGVVYQHLDYAGLKNPAAARERLLFVSALFGLIPAGTPIPAYKLPINGALARYWKPINSARLQQLAGGRPVLNLLSQSYAKAAGYTPMISPGFKVAGGKKPAGHFGKAIKGRFIRFLLEEEVTQVDGFARFQEDGYQWDGRDFVQA